MGATFPAVEAFEKATIAQMKQIRDDAQTELDRKIENTKHEMRESIQDARNLDEKLRQSHLDMVEKIAPKHQQLMNIRKDTDVELQRGEQLAACLMRTNEKLQAWDDELHLKYLKLQDDQRVLAEERATLEGEKEAFRLTQEKVQERERQVLIREIKVDTLATSTQAFSFRPGDDVFNTPPTSKRQPDDPRTPSRRVSQPALRSSLRAQAASNTQVGGVPSFPLPLIQPTRQQDDDAASIVNLLDSDNRKRKHDGSGATKYLKKQTKVIDITAELNAGWMSHPDVFELLLPPKVTILLV